MRNLFFSLFAISVAAVASMMATTAMINAPVRQASAPVANQLAQAEPPPGGENAPATPEVVSTPGPGAAVPDAPPPAGAEGAATPDAKTPGASDEEGDKDPYEGIAAEELPPDLQYSADSSVSFPTNI
jgi:hypothetical protein